MGKVVASDLSAVEFGRTGGTLLRSQDEKRIFEVGGLLQLGLESFGLIAVDGDWGITKTANELV